MPVPDVDDVDFTVVLAVVGFVFDVSFVVDVVVTTVGFAVVILLFVVDTLPITTAPSVTSGSR